jgi:hypothetical protein
VSLIDNNLGHIPDTSAGAWVMIVQMGAQGPSGVSLNLQKIVALRQYNTNSGNSTIKVAPSPDALAFDGTNMRVANYYSNSVMRFNASGVQVGMRK